MLGSAVEVHAGEHIQASGQWQQHREHGPQFRASFLQAVPPSTIEGIRRYLGSGLIKGIGPHFADRLVKAFGEGVFEVIERTPERLLEVDGIGKTRLNASPPAGPSKRSSARSWCSCRAHGVGTSRAVRIFKTYGADAIPLVKENPYRLARDIRGIGFMTADQIAQKLGIPKSSIMRARAGITYALLQAVENGDCGLPEAELLTLAQKLLEVERGLLAEALALELAGGAWLPTPSMNSRVCSCRICAMPRMRSQWPSGTCRQDDLHWAAIDAVKAIDWVEARLGVRLAPGQTRGRQQGLVVEDA